MAKYMALLERFPHGTFFVKQYEKLPTASQYNARKLAEQWAKEQATERPVVVVVYCTYYNDPTPRYKTHVNITTTATIRECIEALGETQWST